MLKIYHETLAATNKTKHTLRPAEMKTLTVIIEKTQKDRVRNSGIRQQ